LKKSGPTGAHFDNARLTGQDDAEWVFPYNSRSLSSSAIQTIPIGWTIRAIGTILCHTKDDCRSASVFIADMYTGIELSDF
jgi:hypothetical protein